MENVTLNWYDLNEIITALYTRIERMETLVDEYPYNDHFEITRKIVVNQKDKVKLIMEQLTSLPNNQSDYELRIVSKVDNKVVE